MNSLLDVFKMDISYFEKNVPVVKDLYTIMLAIGWALLIGNLVFQASKSMMSGIGFEGEDPKLLFTRTFVFSFLLVASRPICNIGLDLTSTMMELLDTPTSISMTLPEDSTFMMPGDAAWILTLIIGIMLMYQLIRLIIEVGERYIVLAVLTLISPLAFGMGGSKNTSEIFTGFCRLYGSMCLMMILGNVFLKLYLSGMSMMPTGLTIFPWLIMMIGIARVARKIDSIISRVGLNPAITGAPLGSGMPGALLVMAAKSMASNVTKTMGKQSVSKGNSGNASGNSSGTSPKGPPPGPAPVPHPPPKAAVYSQQESAPNSNGQQPDKKSETSSPQVAMPDKDKPFRKNDVPEKKPSRPPLRPSPASTPSGNAQGNSQQFRTGTDSSMAGKRPASVGTVVNNSGKAGHVPESGKTGENQSHWRVGSFSNIQGKDAQSTVPANRTTLHPQPGAANTVHGGKPVAGQSSTSPDQSQNAKTSPAFRVKAVRNPSDSTNSPDSISIKSPQPATHEKPIATGTNKAENNSKGTRFSAKPPESSTPKHTNESNSRSSGAYKPQVSSPGLNTNQSNSKHSAETSTTEHSTGFHTWPSGANGTAAAYRNRSESRTAPSPTSQPMSAANSQTGAATPHTTTPVSAASTSRPSRPQSSKNAANPSQTSSSTVHSTVRTQAPPTANYHPDSGKAHPAPRTDNGTGRTDSEKQPKRVPVRTTGPQSKEPLQPTHGASPQNGRNIAKPSTAEYHQQRRNRP